MNLVSKKQFAALCGLATNRLSVEIKRGKVAMTGDQIDTDYELNANFIQKYKEKSGDISSGQESETEIKKQVDAEFDKLLSAGNVRNVDTIKKIEETKRIVVDTRLKLLKEAKDKGENIPTDNVKTIITQLSKSFTSKFFIAADNYTLEMGKKYGLSREEMANMRKSLREVINEANGSAIDEAKRDIRNLIKQTTIKKGVGEHD